MIINIIVIVMYADIVIIVIVMYADIVLNIDSQDMVPSYNHHSVNIIVFSK